MRRAMTTALALTALLVGVGSAGAQSPSQTAAPSAAVPASTAAPASTATPGVSAQTARKGSDPSTGAIVLLAAVGALLLLAAVGLAAARWWAWEPLWLLRFRHAGSEAGWRTSAAWAEFRDWVRLGR